ncbi:hypothetical protein LCGC14_3078820 [marine sediment metagenome]|uniref:Uncharacterized protein n=1 Tax=marine sediment metagenome TaxID=412755 RepID=A0A0F8Z4M8_9ZZZZ
MGVSREVQDSRSTVVDCFLTRRSRGSLDGSVHTSGDVLCVGPYHVAFWHQGMIYITPLEGPLDDLVKTVQAKVRLENHGHRVAELEVGDE